MSLLSLYFHGTHFFQEHAIITTNDGALIHKLSAIHAYHMRYALLLGEGAKLVKFIRQANPPIPSLTEAEKLLSDCILARECDGMLSRIVMLKRKIKQQKGQVFNLMDLESLHFFRPLGINH